MLVVVPNDDDLHNVDDITKHKTFVAKSQAEMDLKVVITKLEDFKNDKKEDMYDFVVFAYFSSFN